MNLKANTQKQNKSYEIYKTNNNNNNNKQMRS